MMLPSDFFTQAKIVPMNILGKVLHVTPSWSFLACSARLEDSCGVEKCLGIEMRFETESRLDV